MKHIFRCEKLEARSLLSGTTIDRSFGDAGRGTVVPDSGMLLNAYLITETADGKILEVGSAEGGFLDNWVAFARLNADGTPDTSFGNRGALFALAMSRVVDAKLLASGKILVAGQQDQQLILARFSSDGSLDSTFGKAGVARLSVADPSTPYMVSGVAAASDGTIAVVGTIEIDDNADREFVLARVMADGGIDSAFGGDGTITSHLSHHVTSLQVAMQDDGKPIVVGSEGFTRFAARYTTAGLADSTFAGNGFFAFEPHDNVIESDNTATAVTLQPDGKILVGGFEYIARLTTNGALDESFGNQGEADVFSLDKQVSVGDEVATGSDVSQIFVDSQGRIVAVDGLVVLRLKASGQPDGSFGQDGSVSLANVIRCASLGGDDVVISDLNFTVSRITTPPKVALGPYGRLVVTGEVGDDAITVNSSAGRVLVHRNGSVTNYDAASVKQIDIDAGDGNNTITSSLALPTSIGSGTGADTILTASGADNISSGEGSDSVVSGDGQDTINADEGNNFVDAGGDRDIIVTGSGNDTIDAGAGINEIRSDGNEGNGNGDDSILGGDGFDEVLAGGGNNFIDVGDGGSFVICGSGNDTLIGGVGDDQLLASDGDNLVTAGDGNDLIRTGIGNDTIYGNGGKDSIRAGEGDDLISGGGGKDTILAQQGRDRIYAGNGDDRVDAGPGNDRVFGGTGNDRLVGGPGNDRLTGDSGRDFLYGVRGDDALFGDDGEKDTLNGGGDDDQAARNIAPNADVLISIEHILV